MLNSDGSVSKAGLADTAKQLGKMSTPIFLNFWNYQCEVMKKTQNSVQKVYNDAVYRE
eukprot:Pgem_evm1s5102